MNYAKIFPRNKHQQNLDSIARLLTDSSRVTGEGNTCTALCIYKGQLIIAKNDTNYYKRDTGSDYSADDTLRHLRLCIGIGQGDAINFFKEKCIKKLKDEKRSFAQFSNISTVLNRLKKSSFTLEVYEELDGLRTRQNLTKQEKTFLEEMLEPMKDFNKVQEYLNSPEGVSLKDIINDPRNYKFLAKEDLISQNASLEAEKEQAKNLHAEIKIAKYLAMKNPRGINSIIDLGISKLSCAGCYSLIKAIEGISRIKFNIPGTHSQPFKYKQDIDRVMSEDIIQRASKHLLSNVVFQEDILQEIRRDFFENISSTAFNLDNHIERFGRSIKRFQPVKHSTNPEIQTSLRSSQTNSREFFLLNTQSVINEQNPHLTPRSEDVVIRDNETYDQWHRNQIRNFAILEEISPAHSVGETRDYKRAQSYVPPKTPQTTSIKKNTYSVGKVV